jgi:hypothetical protein
MISLPTPKGLRPLGPKHHALKDYCNPVGVEGGSQIAFVPKVGEAPTLGFKLQPLWG